MRQLFYSGSTSNYKYNSQKAVYVLYILDKQRHVYAHAQDIKRNTREKS